MASRILLADDSITIQKVVNLTFADEGIEVVAVSNGDLAERRLAEVSPDLVLADIFMPGKNGYELCEAIKENPQFRNIPVVLLVGAFEPFDQVEARRVKADAHLTKPFESRTLVETVRRLISASSRTTTGPIVPPMAVADNGHGEALDLRPVGTTQAPIAPPLPDKLDLSAMVATSVAPSTPQVRKTGELASPSRVAGSDVFGFGIVDAPAPDAVNATLTDTSQQFEPLEFSPNGGLAAVEVAPSFDLDVGDSQSNEEIQAFNPEEPIDLGAVQSPTLFATIPPSVLDEVDISGSGEGEHWYNTGSLESSRRSSEDAEWRTPNNGSPLSYQPPDLNLHTETSSGVSETAKETACATLLAVDEPLGDVLFDQAVPPDSVVSTASGDSLGLDLGEAGVAVAAFEPSTQFDLVEIVETPPVETTPAAQENHAEQFSAEALENVFADAVDEVAAPQTPVAEDVLGHAPMRAEAQPLSHEAVGEPDWTTPKATSYSTAKLDSVVMPINTAEYLREKSPSEDVQEPADIEETAFTTSATWTEEEARFTPIDIEAVAVEDTVVEEGSSLMSASASDLSLADQPAGTSETFVAQSAETDSNGSLAAPLSSAAVEEIVRRVVAEMSESVVREIAWEVVPDCVERVIEQLTRESLSKRA